MKCSVCDCPFIRTENYNEFYSIKMEFENKMSGLIDSLSEEEMKIRFDEIWLEILRHEALLLKPREEPQKGRNGELICAFCTR